MTDVAWPPVLACGIQPELLLASVADGDESVPAAHIAGCPHCGRALAQMTPLLRFLHIADQVPLAVPARVERHLLAHIRRLRAGAAVEIPSDPGRTTVAEDVVASLVRAGVEQVAGVRSAQVTARPPALAFEIRLVVGSEAPIPVIAAAARSAVERVVADQLSSDVARIDIDITDIDLPVPPP